DFLGKIMSGTQLLPAEQIRLPLLPLLEIVLKLLELRAEPHALSLRGRDSNARPLWRQTFLFRDSLIWK
ncbi:hypothetical protein ACQCR7_25480, partial [Ralstonia pseudosolanacearum]|uniref:hypothetical protein n=1 Tax=Ralstonia pseudosolanacearum TaxID=1310165 RepID=UPI003CEB6FB5